MTVIMSWIFSNQSLNSILSLKTKIVFAEVMGSTNYKMQFDSTNSGGALSSSDNYSLEDTAGEIATGDSGSGTYNIHAGYQQMDADSSISLTAASDVTMSPALGGITGGTSNGQTSTTVTTNNSTGYALYIVASSTPAMQGDSQGSSIANYTPAGANPDFTFLVGATAGEFGFTPEGTDIVQAFLDDGASTCNTGSTNTADACWNSITTTNQLVASRGTSAPGGIATTLKFRITLGSSHFLVEDTYTATTTITAIAL